MKVAVRVVRRKTWSGEGAEVEAMAGENDDEEVVDGEDFEWQDLMS